MSEPQLFLPEGVLEHLDGGKANAVFFQEHSRLVNKEG
jgi:hypothetical protein